MTNQIISGCGNPIEEWEGCEASFNLRLTMEEIKIVLMGLKKRQKRAKGEKTINKFQLKIEEIEQLLDNLPEKAPWQREKETGLYNTGG